MLFNFKELEYDNYGIPEQPLIILKTGGNDIISPIGNYLNLKMDIKFNDVSEATFTIPSVDLNGDSVDYFEKITGNKIVNISPYGDFILISPKEANDGIKKTKECTAYSLEYKFNKKNIALEGKTYEFYNPVDNSNTIMGILMEKMIGWSIGEIDSKLVGKYRTFDDISAKLYSFMMETLQTTYDCLFMFDTSNRKINVISSDNTPKNLPIFLSYDNLINNMNISELSDKLVTCVSLQGSDPVDISLVNPLGGTYIYSFDYYIQNGDITGDLATKVQKWDKTVETLQPTFKQVTEAMVNKGQLATLLEYQRKDLTSDYDSLDAQIAVTQQALDDAKTVEEDNSEAIEAYEAVLIKAKTDKQEVVDKFAVVGYEYTYDNIQTLYDLYIGLENGTTTDERADLIKEITLIGTMNHDYYKVVTDEDSNSDLYAYVSSFMTETFGTLNNTRFDYFKLAGNRAEIVHSLEYKTYFSEDERIALSNYLIEDSIVNENFVLKDYAYNLDDDLVMTLSTENNASVLIESTEIENIVMPTLDVDVLNEDEDVTLSQSTIDDTLALLSEGNALDIYNMYTGTFEFTYTNTSNGVVYKVKGDIQKLIYEYDKTQTTVNNVTSPRGYQLNAILLNTTKADLSSGTIQNIGTSNVTLYGTLENQINNTNNLAFDIIDGTNFITSKTSQYQNQSVSQELYDYGEIELKKIAYPQFQFDISTSNFLFSEQFETYKNNFEMGSTLNIEVNDDYYIKPIIIGVSLDYEDPTKFDLTISTDYRSSDAEFKLVDLLGKSVTTSTGLSLNKTTYAAYSESGAKSTIDNFMQNNFDIAKKTITNSDSQNITWNNKGMFYRKQNTNGTFDPAQVGVVNNMIAFTNDSWESVQMAIGKFQDENTGSSYGLSAPNLVGTLLAGKNLVIENKNEVGDVLQFKVDESGVFINNATLAMERENEGKMLIDPRWGFAAGNTDLYSLNDSTVTPSFIDSSGNVTYEAVGTSSGIKMPVNTNFYLAADGRAFFKGDVYAENMYAENADFKNKISASKIDVSSLVVAGKGYDPSNTKIIRVETGSINTAEIGNIGIFDVLTDTNGDGYLASKTIKIGPDNIVLSGSTNMIKMGSSEDFNSARPVIAYTNGLLVGNSSDSTTIRGSGNIQVDGDLKVSGDIKGDNKITGNLIVSGDLYQNDDIHLANNGNLLVASDSDIIYNGMNYATGTGLVVSSNGYIKQNSSSSRRIKNHISKDIMDKLSPNLLYDIDTVQYRYNDEILDKNDPNYNMYYIGFIAEDIYKKYPIGALRGSTGEVIDWEVRTIVPPMLKLIQDQKKQLDDLEERLRVIEGKKPKQQEELDRRIEKHNKKVERKNKKEEVQ